VLAEVEQGDEGRGQQLDLACRVASERGGGRDPVVVDDLAPVDDHGAGWRGGDEEPGGEATVRGARIRRPVRERHQPVRLEDEARLLLRLAHRRPPGRDRLVGVRVGVVDPAAGKDPHAAGEAQPAVATEQQGLHPISAVAHHDHRCRGDRVARHGPAR
jgi:hypothetical protein